MCVYVLELTSHTLLFRELKYKILKSVFLKAKSTCSKTTKKFI